jgi:hypothetical protein
MNTYKKENWTISDFILRHPEIDCNPVHQRLDREPKMIGGSEPSKAQGVIRTLLKGWDINQITMHETPDGKFRYESIDGGHRKRYILAFHGNKFPDFDSGKFFRDFSKGEKDAFLGAQLTFCIYSNLKPWEVGEIFRALNESTPVNHQEMLNSHGDTPIANAIRETSRAVIGLRNNCHQLFEYSENNTDHKKKYTLVAFDNDGLRIDEMVARIFYRYYDGGGLGVSDKDDLENLYKAEISDEEAKALKKKVKSCLDFVHSMAALRKHKMNNNLPQKEFVMFSRIWLYLEQKYGEFTINDERELFNDVYRAYSPYKLKYDDQPKALQKSSPLDSGKTIGKQFNDSLGEFRPAKSVSFPIECLLKSIDFPSLITPRDKQRIFPREWREAKLVDQDYKCAISGEIITMETSQGAHIIAWSLGGKTLYTNLAMVATHHNSKMGSMSVHEYKELLGF